jgi:hypothetical protein
MRIFLISLVLNSSRSIFLSNFPKKISWTEEPSSHCCCGTILMFRAHDAHEQKSCKAIIVRDMKNCHRSRHEEPKMCHAIACHSPLLSSCYFNFLLFATLKTWLQEPFHHGHIQLYI